MIAVTGSSGFLGRAVCKALNEKGLEFIQLSSRLDDLAGLESELRFIDAVIHLAGLNKSADESLLFKTNEEGTANLILACKKNQVKRLIFSSSQAVYPFIPEVLPVDESLAPAPYNDYGRSKLAAENLCLSSELDVVILRLAILYGKGQFSGFVPGVFCKNAIEERPIIIFGDGENTDDYLHVDDAALAVIAALDSDASGIFNIGSGEQHSLNDIANTIVSVLAQTKIIRQKGDSSRHFFMSISKAGKILKWKPRISLKEGIAMQLESQ